MISRETNENIRYQSNLSRRRLLPMAALGIPSVAAGLGNLSLAHGQNRAGSPPLRRCQPPGMQRSALLDDPRQCLVFTRTGRQGGPGPRSVCRFCRPFGELFRGPDDKIKDITSGPGRSRRTGRLRRGRISGPAQPELPVSPDWSPVNHYGGYDQARDHHRHPTASAPLVSQTATSNNHHLHGPHSHTTVLSANGP